MIFFQCLRLCLFRLKTLFSAFTHKKLLRTAKHLAFDATSIRIVLDKNNTKSTWMQNWPSRHNSRNSPLSRFWTLWTTSCSSARNPHHTLDSLCRVRFSENLVREKLNQTGLSFKKTALTKKLKLKLFLKKLMACQLTIENSKKKSMKLQLHKLQLSTNNTYHSLMSI